ncbi:MAG TPA: glycosyltransferase N-terminal domain-containing protein [Thermoanaerobaculia bacterium]|jgi:3-deoxy-D-manno-octulosonic-acid transferase|nr:glycosyltransferase N-terminal domain-containing protein [Thermoanaerobaculia bacterium]
MSHLSRADLVAQLRPFIRREKIATLVFEPSYLRGMSKGRWDRLRALWGRYPGTSFKGGLWIHAISIGEMKTAIALAGALPKNLPLVITTFEHWALNLGREQLGQRAAVTFFPAPFPSAMRRFIRRFAPAKLVIVEGGQLQPLLALATIGRELPAAVVDGWFNDIQFRRLHDLAPFLHWIQWFGVRHEGDRKRLVDFGVPEARIRITGDLKFHGSAPTYPDVEAQIRQLAGGRPILIAGSTDPREEPQVLDAFEQLGGGQRALLILATRHSRDFQASEALLRNRRLDYRKRSQLPAAGRPAVVFLDQLGELAALYRLAAAVFVGGSLVPDGGGQSPLEAARAGMPIAVGPAMKNFSSVAEVFDRAEAWQRVADSEGLARAWTSWLEQPALARALGERAAKLIDSQQGALDRTLELLASFLESGTGEASALS